MNNEPLEKITEIVDTLKQLSMAEYKELMNKISEHDQNLILELANMFAPKLNHAYYLDINKDGQIIGQKMLSGKIDDVNSVEISEAEYANDYMGMYMVNGEPVEGHHYAILDNENNVLGVQTHKSEHAYPRTTNAIEIPKSNIETVYGKKYVDGKWIPRDFQRESEQRIVKQILKALGNK